MDEWKRLAFALLESTIAQNGIPPEDIYWADIIYAAHPSDQTGGVGQGRVCVSARSRPVFLQLKYSTSTIL